MAKITAIFYAAATGIDHRIVRGDQGEVLLDLTDGEAVLVLVGEEDAAVINEWGLRGADVIRELIANELGRPVEQARHVVLDEKTNTITDAYLGDPVFNKVDPPAGGTWVNSDFLEIGDYKDPVTEKYYREVYTILGTFQEEVAPLKKDYLALVDAKIAADEPLFTEVAVK